MRIICKLLILVMLLFCFGCSSGNSYEEITRKYNASNGWGASTVLTWNDKEYVMKINLNYEGKTLIKRVEYTPNFNGEFWPPGYIHPNINSYGWESQIPEGEVPTTVDLSRKIHKKCPDNVKKMTKEEAQNILNTTNITIRVFEANKKSYDIILK